jgi:hypothetical protein
MDCSLACAVPFDLGSSRCQACSGLLSRSRVGSPRPGRPVGRGDGRRAVCRPGLSCRGRRRAGLVAHDGGRGLRVRLPCRTPRRRSWPVPRSIAGDRASCSRQPSRSRRSACSARRSSASPGSGMRRRRRARSGLLRRLAGRAGRRHDGERRGTMFGLVVGLGCGGGLVLARVWPSSGRWARVASGVRRPGRCARRRGRRLVGRPALRPNALRSRTPPTWDGDQL